MQKRTPILTTLLLCLSLVTGALMGCTNDVTHDDVDPNAPASTDDDRDGAHDAQAAAKKAPPPVDTSASTKPAVLKKQHDMTMD